MVLSHSHRLATVALSITLLATACAEPVIRAVTAPATSTPVPLPTATPAPTVENVPTPTPAPFEGEPGLTADTIRIGVIFDVGAGVVADQLSRSAPDAVIAWAAAVNGDGGIAGRSVEVIPIETHPLLADHAAAIDFACNSGLFALVGSTALFDNEGLEQLESANCRLPDFPAVVSSTERLQASVTTVSNPITSDLWQAGWAAYFVDSDPEAASAAATMLLDFGLEFDISIINGERTIEAATAQGYDFVYREQVPFDTDFSAEVLGLSEADAQLLTWRGDGGRLIDLLETLDASEFSVPVIDCGQACYSDTWVEAAGSAGEGVSVWLPTHPLEESDQNTELLRYLFFNGKTNGANSQETSVGILAWASALLFEEAVNRAVGSGTAAYDKDSLTRASVIAAANTIVEWTARGLHGTSNPAAGIPSSCFVLLTLSDGVWDRTFPARRGQLDCASRNLVPLSITPGLGSEPTPTPVPADG